MAKKEDNRLKMISFRVDDETFKALRALEDMVGGEDGIVSSRRRSIAIRRAIINELGRSQGHSKGRKT